MRDRGADRGAFDIEAAAGSVDAESQHQGSFPVDAFEFDRPTASSPKVRLRSGWAMVVEGYDLMDRIERLEARLVALHGWWDVVPRVQTKVAVKPVTVSIA